MLKNKIVYIIFTVFFTIFSGVQASNNVSELKDKILSGDVSTLPSTKKIYIGSIDEVRKFIEIKKASPEKQKILIGNYIDEQIKKLNEIKQISEKDNEVNEELFQKIILSVEDSKKTISEAIDKNEDQLPLLKELDFLLLKILIAGRSVTWTKEQIEKFKETDLNQILFKNIEDTYKFYDEKIMDKLSFFYFESRICYKDRHAHLGSWPFMVTPKDSLTGLISLNISFLNDIFLIYLPKNKRCILHISETDRHGFAGHDVFHLSAERGHFYNGDHETPLKENAKKIFTDLLLKSYNKYEKEGEPILYFKAHLLMFLVTHESKGMIFITKNKLFDQDVPLFLDGFIKYFEEAEKNLFIPGDYVLLYFFKELGYKLPESVDMKNLKMEKNQSVENFLNESTIEIAKSLKELYKEDTLN